MTYMLVQQSLVAMADQEIRRLILAGELAPGDRLRESRLSERLGISRPPLREALRILAAQRIVEQTPRYGYRVVELSAADVEEIYSLRHALEEFAVTRMLPILQSTDLDALTEIMARMWQAAHAGDEAAIVNVNREFHIAFVALARHGRLLHAYQTVMDQMQLCMSRNLRKEANSIGDLFEGCRRHDRLLDSLRGKDPEQIRVALQQHGERSFLDASRTDSVADAAVS